MNSLAVMTTALVNVCVLGSRCRVCEIAVFTIPSLTVYVHTEHCQKLLLVCLFCLGFFGDFVVDLLCVYVQSVRLCKVKVK